MYTSATDVFGPTSIFVTTATTSVPVYFFQAGALFCTENAKFWPILANLGHFVPNLHTFWCSFTGQDNTVVPQIDKY